MEFAKIIHLVHCLKVLASRRRRRRRSGLQGCLPTLFPQKFFYHDAIAEPRGDAHKKMTAIGRTVGCTDASSPWRQLNRFCLRPFGVLVAGAGGEIVRERVGWGSPRLPVSTPASASWSVVASRLTLTRTRGNATRKNCVYPTTT